MGPLYLAVRTLALSWLLVHLSASCGVQSGMKNNPSLEIPFPSHYVSGYSKTIAGEELRYHSPIPHVDRSLLVRSLDRRRYIEWETASLPPGHNEDETVFVFMGGIDVNTDVRRFDLQLNGEPVLQFENPSSTEERSLRWEGTKGVTAEFKVTEIDKYNDAMGFVFLSVPSSLLSDGEPARLRVAGESAGGSWCSRSPWCQASWFVTPLRC